MITFDKGSKKQITKNFWEYEMACKCKQDHENLILKSAVEKWQGFRDLLNKMADDGLIERINPEKDISFKINRAYSCKIHNKRVGGSSDSKHMYGVAADIAIQNIKDIDYEKISMLAKEFGFTGIGKYDNRIHLDVRDGWKYAYGFATWDKRTKK
jgi:hypothetical protein